MNQCVEGAPCVDYSALFNTHLNRNFELFIVIAWCGVGMFALGFNSVHFTFHPKMYMYTGGWTQLAIGDSLHARGDLSCVYRTQRCVVLMLHDHFFFSFGFQFRTLGVGNDIASREPEHFTHRPTGTRLHRELRCVVNEHVQCMCAHSHPNAHCGGTPLRIGRHSSVLLRWFMAILTWERRSYIQRIQEWA